MKLVTPSLFIILFIFFASCKKKVSETVVKGVVYSSVESSVVSGAHVKFYIKKLSSNSFSSSFDLHEDLVVSSDGQFKFSFLKTSSDVEYKIEVISPSYRSGEVVINPSNIDAGEENVKDQYIVPFGSVSFRLKSGVNSNSTDELLFNFKNELESGESFLSLLFLGNQIDTMLVTDVVAEKYNKFNYIIKRNGMLYNINDSVFCGKGNTTQKDIVY